MEHTDKRIVAIYEGNAGSIYLHADGGSILYESAGKDALEECRTVSAWPDGEYANWSESLRHPWAGEETLAAGTQMLAIYAPALDRIVLEAEAQPGTAGSIYLARSRVEHDADLARHRAVLLGYDWHETDHHQWVATAPKAELLSWAETVEAESER